MALALPIVATQLVKAILFLLEKLYELTIDVFPTNAPIVQSAIDLTSAHGNVISIGLCAYTAFFIWTHMRPVSSQTISKAMDSA